MTRLRHLNETHAIPSLAFVCVRGMTLWSLKIRALGSARWACCLREFSSGTSQFALLMILVLLPLQMLSGGMTPRESVPGALTTHFVMVAQDILFRGAGLEVVWKPFLALAVIGAVLFTVILRFRKTIATT